MERINLSILSLGIVTVAGLRVLMATLPNIEPVMLFTVVMALSLGPISGFLVGLGSMILSNIFMVSSGSLFPWIFHMPLVTLYTSLTYGLIGLIVGFLGIVKRDWKRSDFTLLIVVMTLFYDLVTAICFGVQFYGFAGIPVALNAQIPFTVLHLSNAIFAFLFAPYLFRAFTKAKEISVFGFLNGLRLHT